MCAWQRGCGCHGRERALTRLVARPLALQAPTAPAPVQTKPAATPEPQAAAPATPSQPQAAPQSQAGDFERVRRCRAYPAISHALTPPRPARALLIPPQGLVKGEQKVLERAQAAVDTVVATAKLEIQRQKDEAAAAERAALEKWLKEAKKDMYRCVLRGRGDFSVYRAGCCVVCVDPSCWGGVLVRRALTATCCVPVRWWRVVILQGPAAAAWVPCRADDSVGVLQQAPVRRRAMRGCRGRVPSVLPQGRRGGSRCVHCHDRWQHCGSACSMVSVMVAFTATGSLRCRHS